MRIPECPASDICRMRAWDCAACEDLSAKDWKKRVRLVMSNPHPKGYAMTTIMIKLHR